MLVDKPTNQYVQGNTIKKDIHMTISYKELIELIIQALGVMATFSAVLTSLYFSQRQHRVDLHIVVDIRKIAGQGKHLYLVAESLKGNGERILCFFIRNKGVVAHKLQSTDFYFDFGIPHKMINNIALDSDWMRYPRELSGMECTCVAISNYKEFLQHIAEDVEIRNNLNKMRAFIVTGSGKRIYAKIHKSLKKKIMLDVQQICTSKA